MSTSDGENAGSDQAFEYPPAPLHDDQIRILNIQPGSGSDTLCCTLETIERSSDAVYKALSYVWGHDDPSHCVFVDGTVCKIRQNLNDALHRIREEDRIVKLWTDAICINQENTVERNGQVQSMGQTYAQAEDVLVWLGKAGSSSHVLKDVCFPGRDINAVSKDELVSKLKAFEDLIARHWFGRLRVIQEVLLARKCLVMLDEEVCDLDRLLDVFGLRMDVLARSFEALDYQIKPSSALRDDLNQVGDIVVLQRFYRSASKEIRGLVDLVVLAGGFNCLDPRDHIFGLVGLSRQAGMNSIQVDYTLSTWEIYAQFMQDTLLAFPDTLCFFADLVADYHHPELPSWLPDFSVEMDGRSWRYKGYNAGGASVTQLRLDLMSRAENFFLGNEADETLHGDMHGSYQDFWRSLIDNHFIHNWSPDDTTIITEAVPYFDSHDAYGTLVSRAHRASVQDEMRKYVKKLAPNILYTMRGMAMLRTNKGSFGDGPKASVAGDIIVVIPGLPMPLILRKRNQGETYQLIGSAYVHGIMNGEFLEAASKDPNARLQTFVMD